MGWKSTALMLRRDVIAELIRHAHTASDMELEFALEGLIGDRVGHNFLIVDSEDEVDARSFMLAERTDDD